MAKQQSRSFELVFIPIPGVGHLLPMVEMGQRLMARSSSAEDDRKISAAVTVLKFPYPDDKIDSYVESLKSERNNPHPVTVLEVPPLTVELTVSNPMSFLSGYLDAYKPIIKQALLDRYGCHNDDDDGAPQLGGLILDMFCTGMMDVADELGVPSYIFFTSGAALLSLTFHLHSLGVDIPQTYGTETQTETSVEIAGFSNPVSVKVWPTLLLSKAGADMWFGHATRYRRSKGIMVNTFMELESSIIQSLSSSSSSSSGFGSIPPIYPVGPVLNLPKESNITINSEKNREIIGWLDSQPPSSVVFLCFGSRGSFDVDQVKEIAVGLERSGHRFLWSLRSRGASPASASASSSASSSPPPPRTEETGTQEKETDKDSNNNNANLKFPQLPGEYEDLSQVLPEGFLDRTSQVGKVIGWAPQVEVLAHKAVGAFVSHCGWNSTLESLWFGVPMLTWPMYAEQQMNAFMLVKELGLAMEIKVDYRNDFRVNNGVANVLVGAEVVEEAITSMMESEQGQLIRKKVKHVSESARKAVLQPDGSSNMSIDRFAEYVLQNIVSK